MAKTDRNAIFIKPFLLIIILINLPNIQCSEDEAVNLNDFTTKPPVVMSNYEDGNFDTETAENTLHVRVYDFHKNDKNKYGQFSKVCILSNKNDFILSYA
jgi:hypothetical protein